MKMTANSRSGMSLAWAVVTGIVLLGFLAVPILSARYDEGNLTNEGSGQSGAQLVASEPSIVFTHDWDNNPVAYIPESTMSSGTPSADILRQAKPNFDGGHVPESTMRRQMSHIDILRLTKPDFAGVVVPESTMRSLR